MNNTSSDPKAPLTLRVVCPDKEPVTVVCDSVRLCIRDDAKGRGGGLLGIRHGHAPAVMALDGGTIRAFMQGEPVYEQSICGGLAAIRDNVVTVFPEDESPK